MKGTNEDIAQVARTAVRMKNFIEPSSWDDGGLLNLCADVL